MNIFIVGGTFDDNGGQRSGFVAKFYAEYKYIFNVSIALRNGGDFSDLTNYMADEDILKWADVIYWFANIPNDKAKLVGEIKRINPKAILIISKNNLEEKYQRLMLVARALQAKANLLIEFKRFNGLYSGTVIDPLNNVFCENEADIPSLVRTVHNRVVELTSFTRIPSVKVGEAIECPKEERFFEIARKHADTFHTLIHAVNQGRFLGNLSFRCERGFPSFRKNGFVFVSQRNIDKRNINENGFVAVNADVIHQVEYYGDVKPSVDTPIQVRLYEYYMNVKFMLHAHVYIEGAPLTNHLVPCGAIEEFDEVVHHYPEQFHSNFCVNLKGHGSLILAQNVEFLEDIPFVTK